MEGEIVQKGSKSYVQKKKGEERIEGQQDILDLMGYCTFSGGGKILIEEEDLAEHFFDLSSGLAGDILLKLSIYQVKTAFVVNLDNIESRAFQQLVMESNRGKQINFFPSKHEAENWLLGN